MIKGLIRGNRLVSTGEVLAEAAQVGHVEGIPLMVLVQALYNREVQGPTASVVAGGAWRRAVIAALIDYYIDITQVYAMVRGSLIHGGLEVLDPPDGVEIVREKRMRVAVPKMEGVYLSGQIDAYFKTWKRLEDYKSCRTPPPHMSFEHLVQLAEYTWLCRWSGMPVEQVAINYVGWDQGAQVTTVATVTGVVQAIQHPLVADEMFFVSYLARAWDILQAGFGDRIVPDMTNCTTRYCRNCSVRWACDRIPEWGDVIDPKDFDQARCT